MLFLRILEVEVNAPARMAAMPEARRARRAAPALSLDSYLARDDG